MTDQVDGKCLQCGCNLTEGHCCIPLTDTDTTETTAGPKISPKTMKAAERVQIAIIKAIDTGDRLTGKDIAAIIERHTNLTAKEDALGEAVKVMEILSQPKNVDATLTVTIQDFVRETLAKAKVALEPE